MQEFHERGLALVDFRNGILSLSLPRLRRDSNGKEIVMTFVVSTNFESEIIAQLMEANEYDGSVAIHRMQVLSDGIGAEVIEETNDDNDDGYADGEWKTWRSHFDKVDDALKYVGKCHVGVSGVIITVMHNGKEIR
jgi:hypothetical protein